MTKTAKNGTGDDTPVRSIREPARQLPVIGEVQVAVVGGGIAGVAAALAAARLGAKTCLIEKETALGGLATLGNVIIYLPLCDGRGRQVIGGLGEELLRLSVRDGFHRIPACWEKNGDLAQRQATRFRVDFNPASYMLALEELLLASGVEIMYDTRFCDVRCQAGRVTTLILENKSGRVALDCQTVVDASGDADVCARAGEPTESLRTNVACGWFFHLDRTRPAAAGAAATAQAAGETPWVDAAASARLQVMAMSKEFPADPRLPPPNSRGYAGDSGPEVTAHVLASHAMMREQLAELQRTAPANTEVYPAILPLVPSFRMTRRLVGTAEIQYDDDRRYVEDAVGMTGDWRRRGPIYYIPYGSVTGVRNANLAVAGRCMSAAGPAWDVTRVIPGCAVTGEAAGTAAAMAVRDTAGRLPALPVAALQTQLRQQGVLIEKAFATR